MKTVLKNKLFLATFFSDMLSNFGDVVYYLALMNYVLLLPQAKLGISLVTLSESLPFLTQIFMSVLGDRTQKKIDTILWTLLFRVGLYLLVGMVMGFEPALWILLVAVVVNLLSDLAGQYENALYTPLSLRVVKDEDREAMFAFRQGTSSILTILFQSSGAILIGLMSYQQLAFVNAGTFLTAALIMFFLRPSFQRLLKEHPLQLSQPESSQEKQQFMKEIWQGAQEAYRTAQHFPLIQKTVLIIAGLNAVFAGQEALLLLTIKENETFVLVNTATTLSILLIVKLLANVLGSILSTTLLKQVEFFKLIKQTAWMPVFLFIAFYLQNIYLVILVNFCSMVIVGAIQPKLNAFIVRSLPEDRLATIAAGIDTFCTFGLVGARLLMSGLVVVLLAWQISLLFLGLSLLLLLWTLKPNKREVLFSKENKI